jgi:transaldolase
MKSVSELKVKIFADGADKDGMIELYRRPYIKGFTTNPTLMRKAGVKDYEGFARDILQHIPDRPISFEVFADDEDDMERQARRISSWAANVYVKIPVTNTRREPMYGLIRRLSADGIQVNATAVLALDQVSHIA